MPIVIQRDIANARILIGGVGKNDIGQMWFDEREDHQHYPNYAQAEVMPEPPRNTRMPWE